MDSLDKVEVDITYDDDYYNIKVPAYTVYLFPNSGHIGHIDFWNKAGLKNNASEFFEID